MPAALQALCPYGGDDDASPNSHRQEREGVNVMFVWEAVRPLLYGHAAVVIPDHVIVDATRLVPFLVEHAVTRLLSTPSLLATVLELAADETAAHETATAATELAAPSLAERLPRLALWTLCGEVVPDSLVRRAASLLPAVALCNDYSSWEGSDVSLATLAPS